MTAVRPLSKTQRVSRFLGAMAAAGLHERGAARVYPSDYDADWMKMAVWPLARLRSPTDPLTFADLIRMAERQSGIAAAELLGRNQKRGPCRARYALWRACKDHLGWSTTRIGERFDGRDHSTIVHGLDRARAHGLQLEVGLDLAAGPAS